MSGTKHDKGKAPIHFLTREFIEGVSKAQGFGADKYGDYNFCKGIKYTRLLDAAMRHLLAYTWGEDLDPESGESHISHAGANLNMLMFMIKHRADLDDRYKENKTFLTTKPLTDEEKEVLAALDEAVVEVAEEFGLDKNRFLDFSKDKK